MSSDAFVALGEYLTATEAEAIAVLLASGQRLSGALSAVGAARRERAKELLGGAGLGHLQRELSVSVLRAISGAKSVHRELVPVWTMPGNEAGTGHLTSEFHRLVAAARQSITCASYNFETTSQMWQVLRAASDQPGVVVTVYLDGKVSDVAAANTRLPRATVYRSGVLSTGAQIVSHAKFVVIDHELVLLTSANFSFSAENRNVEFGLLVRDSALAESVEGTMRAKQGSLYELV
jgi:phosphatidylserine/phosphatidylglycerophosphate/cardiolipin synthase-like enzyme